MSISLKLDEQVQFERIQLELGRKHASHHIGATTLESMTISRREDPGIAGFIVDVALDVLRAKIHEDKATAYFHWKVPASWWQHFKLEKMPKWFTRRYPVAYDIHRSKRVVTFKRYAEYPKANVHIPKGQRFFIETLGGLEVINDEVSAYGKQGE